MASALPQWLNDVASISSVIGLIVTVFLFIEARGIRDSFLRKARLPQVISELEMISSKISNGLKNWKDNERAVQEQFAISLGLLENIATRLPAAQKNRISDFVKKLRPKKYLFLDKKLNEQGYWDLYTELSTVITMLVQLQKDSTWDNQ